MNIITETESFYGYIIGLQVERCPTSQVGHKLFARFENRGEVSLWEVPDADLFRILANHLCDMAVSRSEVGEYGYSKLWIKKENGRWHVDLP